MYKNCSERQKQFLYTTCSPQVWAWNFHVLNLLFNEQSVVILWVSWCKNKRFWQRFTCARVDKYIHSNMYGNWCNIHGKHITRKTQLFFQFNTGQKRTFYNFSCRFLNLNILSYHLRKFDMTRFKMMSTKNSK